MMLDNDSEDDNTTAAVKDPAAVLCWVKAVKAGAPVDSSDAPLDQICKDRGWGLLHLASMSGDMEIVEKVIEFLLAKEECRTAALPTRLNDGLDKAGYSPLHYACERGYAAVAEKLVFHGASLKQRSSSLRRAALLLAVANGRTATVKVLLQNVKLQDHPQYGRRDSCRTPLTIAAEKGWAKIVQVLLDADAKVNEVGKRQKQGPTDGSMSSEQKPSLGRTALHFAAMNDKVSVVRVLLEHGADVHLRDKEAGGKTALYYAKHPDVVALLRAAEPDTSRSDAEGFTSQLHRASSVGLVTVVDKLLGGDAAGELKNKKDEDGRTPLHCAAEAGRMEVVKRLLGKQVDLLATDKDGRTALHLAVGHGRVEVVRILATSPGVDLEAQDKEGKSLLEYAEMAAAQSDDSAGMAQILEALRVAQRKRQTAVVSGGEVEVIDLLADTPQGIFNLPPSLHVARQGTALEAPATSLLREASNESVVQLANGTQLHRAAYRGNLDKVKEILQNSVADLEVADKLGRTPLLEAAWSGHMSVVSILLEKGASPEATDQWGKTALFRAAEAGRLEVAKKLLEAGAVVHTTAADGSTPLHAAAQNGHLQMVRWLLDNGVDIDEVDTKNGRTALQSAATKGHSEVVKALVEGGASVEAKDKAGKTAEKLAATNLCKADKERKNEIAQAVKSALGLHWAVPLTRAASQHLEEPTCPQPYESTASSRMPDRPRGQKRGGTDMSAQEREGKRSKTQDVSTTLHRAVDFGDADAFARLLQEGADPKERDGIGRLPLHMAAQYGRVEIIELLLKHDPDLVRQTTRQNKTALHLAAEYGKEAAVEVLLQAGADPNATDLTQSTALHKACATTNTEVVRLLLEGVSSKSVRQRFLSTGAKIMLTNRNKETALHIAASMGNHEVVGVLLRYGDVAFIKKLDMDGQTALHIAAAQGHTQAVKTLLLLSSNEVHNMQDKKGNTALHEAARNGHLDIVLLLLDQDGIDVTVANLRGKTAEDMAGVGHDNINQEDILKIQQLLQKKARGYHVFISHAGEQKHGIVDHIMSRFREKYPLLNVFVDEHSLDVGVRSKDHILHACEVAPVGVLVLSPQFVRKEWPMKELQILLRRANMEAGTQKVQLVPFLYGDMTFSEFKKIRKLYNSQPWCVKDAANNPKPDDPQVLDQWAAALTRIINFNIIRQDKWTGESRLVELVVQQVIAKLEQMKKMPAD